MTRSRLAIAIAGLLAADVAGSDGTWKYAPAPENIHATFNGEDPVGLAAGAHIRTDCSIRLVDNGQTYCFTTRTSLETFEESPQTYLRAAHKFFDSQPQSSPRT